MYSLTATSASTLLRGPRTAMVSMAARRGIEVGTGYTLFKNVQLFAKYFNGKDIAADKDAEKLFGRIDVFF